MYFVMANTIDSILEELNNIGEFLASITVPGMDDERRDATRIAIVRSIASKIHHLTGVDYPSASRLNIRINSTRDAGTITADEGNALLQAVIGRVQAAGEVPLGLNRRTPTDVHPCRRLPHQ